MKVRDPNRECFTCGRQLPLDVAVVGTPNHMEFRCPECDDRVLYAIVAQGQYAPPPPPPFFGQIPDAVHSDALWIRDDVDWGVWEMFFVEETVVSYIHGRRVYGSNEEAYFVEEVLDVAGEEYEPRG